MDAAVALPTMDDLQQYVLEILCGHDNLDPEQTPLGQAVILKRKRACGLFFQAAGPRMLKTYAIWAGDEDRILFYDCNGERFAECLLSESPDPRVLAA